MEFIFNTPIIFTITILFSLFFTYLLNKWRYGGVVDSLRKNLLLHKSKLEDKDEYIKKLESGSGINTFKKRMVIDINNFLSALNEFIIEWEGKLEYQKELLQKDNPEIIKNTPNGLTDMEVDHNASMQYGKFKDEALRHFDFLNELIGDEKDNNERSRVRNPTTLDDIKWTAKRIEDMKFAIGKIQ